ncbi:MAG: hypothetical protein N0C90_19830 [Candidatus Thiodiazotropha endolucinida]|nr:hypothetical protein [Candidatus Thiodiazotropha taylori]MCW4263605.1 hypothetical protein [Candidatus Thiodiazotropha endolucinida]
MPVFENILPVIPDLLMYKFQEEPIKAQGTKVMKGKKIGIFSSKGEVTLLELILAFIPDLL